MAFLPLGKLTILIGAGLVGTVLAKEGSLPTTSDLVSGAFKSVWKRLGTNESSTSAPKPKNDAWLQQVNSLREEIQFYASRRPVTIVTTTTSGGRKYTIVVVIMVVGGYLWWKGWKLPDLRFATRRGLSDARADIEKNLQKVQLSIATTKKQVSLKLGVLSSKLEETYKNTEEAHIQVRELLREDLKSTGDRVKSVVEAVQNLEITIDRYQAKQGILFTGIRTILDFVRGHQASAQIEGSTSRRPALGFSQTTPSRVGSLPGNLALEPAPPSPSALNGSVQQGGQPLNVIDAQSSGSRSTSSGFGLATGRSIGSVVNRSRSMKMTFNI